MNNRFNSDKEAEDFINSIPKFTTKNDLSHTRKLLKLLGEPYKEMKIIHIAGSNGKGSVSAMLHSILVEEGYRTGLFISPHLESIRERFQVNGCNATQEQFLEAIDEVDKAIAQLQKQQLPHPSYFEYLFAIGMVIFAKAKVEYAVIETGLGGRLDATNVISNPILTVITSISLEHTNVLGNSLEEIAYEKAGIIKDRVPVIYDGKHLEVDQVIRKVANQHRAPLYPIYPEDIASILVDGSNVSFKVPRIYSRDIVNLPFPAYYQAENGALALQGARILELRGDIGKTSILAGLRKVVWPGRMEEIIPNVYLDGAHNVDGMDQFIQSAQEFCTNQSVLLFAMLEGKKYETVIHKLANGIPWKKIIITEVVDDRGIDPVILEKLFRKELGSKANCCSIIDNDRALEIALREKGTGTLFCTGSLYLVGAMRTRLKGQNDDRL